jgi:hypothetical protein
LFAGSLIGFNSLAFSFNLHTTDYANQLQHRISLDDAKIELVDDGNNTFSDLSRNLTASDGNNNNNPSNDTNIP